MVADIPGRFGKGAIPRTGFRELGPLVAGRLCVGESCRSVCHFSLSPLRTKEVRIRLGGFHLLCVAPPRSLIGFLPTRFTRGGPSVPSGFGDLASFCFFASQTPSCTRGVGAGRGQEHRSMRSQQSPGTAKSSRLRSGFLDGVGK